MKGQHLCATPILSAGVRQMNTLSGLFQSIDWLSTIQIQDSAPVTTPLYRTIIAGFNCLIAGLEVQQLTPPSASELLLDVQHGLFNLAHKLAGK